MQNSADFDRSAIINVSDGVEQSNFLYLFDRRIAHVFRTEEMRLADETSRKNLDKSHIIVVYLQTSILPVENGKFLCVTEKTTPDIEGNSCFDLSLLKSELENYKNKKLVLIVDSPPAGQNMRTGNLHAGLVHEFAQWQKDLPSLVVLLSASESDASEPSNPGTQGQTVFGHFLAAGLSSLADNNGDHDLTVGEFASFVKKKTDSWVRSHRNPHWSGVVVLPESAEEFARRDCLLMRDVQTIEGRVDFGEMRLDQGILERTSEYWASREALRNRGADLWCPVTWIKCTERLQRAERMQLSGRLDDANQLLNEAKTDLKDLSDKTDEYCTLPKDLNSERGISRKLLEKLPSYARCSNELFQSPTDRSSTGAAGSDMVWEPENLMKQHFKVRSGKKNDVGSVLDHLITRRGDAEKLFAEVYDCHHVIPQTLKQLDHDLLLDEDHVFVVLLEKKADSSDSDLSERISALEEFAKTWGKSQTTLRRALIELPAAVGWASARVEDDVDTATELDAWRTVLLASANVDRLQLKFIDEIPEKLGTSAGAPGTSQPEENLLRKAILQFALSTRGLQQTLNDFREAPTGLSAAETHEKTEEFSAWQTKTEELRKKCLELSTRLMSSASVSSWPTDLQSRIQRSRVLRRSLRLTNLNDPEKIRKEALLKISRVDSEDPGAGDRDSLGADPGETQDPNLERQARLSRAVAALWQFQLFKLRPSREEVADEEGLVSLSQQLNGLPEAGPEKEHEVLAEFGKTARTIWKANRDTVTGAARTGSDDALSRLMLADQRCRLFAGIDAQQMNEPLQDRLFQLIQVEYALMQARRHLQSQWIESTKTPTPWYKAAARQWMDVVSKVTEDLRNKSIEIPGSVSQQIDELGRQMNDLEKVQLTVEPQPGDIDLSEVDPAQRQKEFQLKLIQLPSGVDGEAAFRVSVSQGGSSHVALKNEETGWQLKPGDLQRAIVEITRLEEPRHKQDAANVKLLSEVFFRGRVFSGEAVGVNLTGPAEYSIEILASEQRADIFVTGRDPRPVVLVLDFSESMKYPNRKLSSGLFRYEAALDVLKDFSNEPLLEKAHVTLNVFGHRYGTVENEKTKIITGTKNTKYERWFNKTLQDQKSDFANEDVEQEFQERLLLQGSRDRLRDRLDLLKRSEPWGITPLFRALRDALKNDLNGKSGIIIALTDGEPTDDGRSEGQKTDKEPDLTSQLQEALKDNPEATIQIVAFDVKRDADVLIELNKIFGQFKDANGNNRILISDASETDSLKNALVASLDARRFEVIRSQSVPRTQTAELGAGVELQLPHYAAESGVSVKFSSRAEIEKITVAPGDNIRLLINPNFNGFISEREPARNSQDAVGLPQKSTDETQDLATTLSQVTPISRGSDDTSFTLMLDHDDSQRPVRQPEEIEFFVRSSIAPSDNPLSLRQEFDSTKGAPAWKFVAKNWPPNSNFLVDAYWKMSRTAPGEVYPWSDLVQNHATRADAKEIDSVFLPKCRISVKLRDQQLEVRLDPPEASGSDPSDQVLQQVRIELGDGSLLERKEKFIPRKRLPVTKVRIGRSLVCLFPREGISDDDIIRLDVALTSFNARQENAASVKQFRVE